MSIDAPAVFFGLALLGVAVVLARIAWPSSSGDTRPFPLRTLTLIAVLALVGIAASWVRYQAPIDATANGAIEAFSVLGVVDVDDDQYHGKLTTAALKKGASVSEAVLVEVPGPFSDLQLAPVGLEVNAADVLGGELAVGDIVSVAFGREKATDGLVAKIAPIASEATTGEGEVPGRFALVVVVDSTQQRDIAARQGDVTVTRR